MAITYAIATTASISSAISGERYVKSISTSTRTPVIVSNVPSIPSTAIERSALNPAIPVTYEASGRPSGPGRILRIAETSLAIDSVSSRPLITDTSTIDSGVSAEKAVGGVSGPSTWPISPQTAPSGPPTPLSAGSVWVPHSRSV